MSARSIAPADRTEEKYSTDDFSFPDLFSPAVSVIRNCQRDPLGPGISKSRSTESRVVPGTSVGREALGALRVFARYLIGRDLNALAFLESLPYPGPTRAKRAADPVPARAATRL